MDETIEQRGGHFRSAEGARPFAEGEAGGDDDRGPLIKPADQMEQQLAAGLGQGQIGQFVENGEVRSSADRPRLETVASTDWASARHGYRVCPKVAGVQKGER
jgi:hypothetical protein